jgi:hypothetical protein
MAEFNPNPFRGDASVPHVSEEFFKMYFVGCQVMTFAWSLWVIINFYITSNLSDGTLCSFLNDGPRVEDVHINGIVYSFP